MYELQEMYVKEFQFCRDALLCVKKVDKIETHAMRLYINIDNRIESLPKAV